MYRTPLINPAIGQYATWARGENTKCNCWRCDFDLSLNLRDLYDWNINNWERLFGIGVSQAEMKLMHLWGRMQEFKVIGECRTKVAINWHVTEDNKVEYEVDYEPCE